METGRIWIHAHANKAILICDVCWEIWTLDETINDIVLFASADAHCTFEHPNSILAMQ